MKLSDTDLFIALKKSIMSVLASPGTEIQLFLSLIAIISGLLLSILIRRISIRKLNNSDIKHAEVIKKIIASMIPPFMVIMSLVAASWIAPFLVSGQQNHLVIANVTKIGLIWLISSALLLVTQRHFMAYFVSVIMLTMTLLDVTGLLVPTEASLREISIDTDKFHLSLLELIKGTFTLVVLFWGAGVFSKSCESWLRRTTLTFNARELSIKFMRLFLYFMAIVITLTGMGVDLTALTVLGGALAVGLGFGLQKVASNFISGIVLLFERTIEAGDLIEVGNEKGWVRQMAIRHTLIETFDGRDLLIPNEDLVTSKVTNWTYTNTRARIDITVTIKYDSDVELAQKLLVEAAARFKSCLLEPKPAAHLKEFTNIGINIMLIFWIPDVTQGMIAAKSDVMLDIINAFRKSGIQFSEQTTQKI